MDATTLSEDNEHEKEYTMDQLRDYLSANTNPSIFSSEAAVNYHVFWFQETDDGHRPSPTPPLPPPISSCTTSTSRWSGVDDHAAAAAIRERVKKGLEDLSAFALLWDGNGLLILTQFWQPKISNGRRFLTTTAQPFALSKLYKGLIWYRKRCMNHQVWVDEEAKEEDLGPLGRVFLNKQPETSPDLRLYSVKEYPLRDHALRCGMRRYMAYPVFDDLQNGCCIGVLELVAFEKALTWTCFLICQNADTSFKEYHLRLCHMDAQSDTQKEGRKLALSEIKQMFKVVNETPYIPLALAWIPCQGCYANCNCIQRAHYTCDPEWNKQYAFAFDNDCDFLQATYFHKLQKGKGVVGRALSSTNKLCFCRSIYSLNITEYPLSHYARKAMLAVSFAICLQSTHTGSDPYVLEFFLSPGNRDEADPQSLIHSLLTRMKRQLLSFNVASGQQLGEELLVEIVRFRMDDEPIYLQKGQSDKYPLAFKVSAPDAEQRSPSDDRFQQSGQPIEIAEGGVDSSTQAVDKSSEKAGKGVSLQISYEDLKSHFGKPKQKAADSLGVGMA